MEYFGLDFWFSKFNDVCVTTCWRAWTSIKWWYEKYHQKKQFCFC